MSKRPLTDGEIALAKSVFGNSIDYAAVRLHSKRILPLQHKHQAVAFKSHTSFPRSAYSADFSKETDIGKQSVFIHEMVHVWQHQNRVLSTPREAVRETLKHRFNYQKSYHYDLKPHKDLTAYGFEQQAAIVQDYFILKSGQDNASFKNRRQTVGTDAALLQKYETVLARFLRDPTYARKSRAPTPRPPKR